MSCIHCAHCQAERERRDEEALLYERGTALTHPTLGLVTYWRGAPEVSPDTHVVFRDDDENDSHYASAANLTLA